MDESIYIIIALLVGWFTISMLIAAFSISVVAYIFFDYTFRGAWKTIWDEKLPWLLVATLCYMAPAVFF